MMHRFNIVSIAMLLLVALSVASVAHRTAAGSEPEELAKQVEIRRTTYGVPHITGQTLEAVAFGFAYCQAEDHLENIMHSILRARGELARNFGGANNVETDFWNKQYRVHARAVSTYHRLDPDFRSMLEGFAAGLNHYVHQHADDVPEWIPEVSGHDIAAHGMTGVMRFAFNRGNVVKSFLRRKGIDQTAEVLSPLSPETGSNMWALAPQRTDSGHAILMGNPHQAWSQVATYYEAHLIVPGKLNFYGSTFVGRPVLTTGWNRYLGWSHTVNYPDLEEIYELKLDPARADHYRFDGGAVPIERDVAEVQVKTATGLETQRRTFWHTPLGPVIHRDEEHVYVLRSAVYDKFRFYQQWLRMGQAKNLDEFRQALAIRAIPMFNIAYADREGNIFYLWNGTVPDLPHPRHRDEAVAAAKTADIWTRFHDLDQLPQLLNPTGGYVHNCNSPPYFTNLHQPLRRADFPAHFPENNVSLRSQHSLQLIHNLEKFSLEDVRDKKHSMQMLLADRVKDDLLLKLRSGTPSSEVQKAAALLEQWDNTVRAKSRGSVLFEAWWNKYYVRGGDNFATPWSEDSPTTTPHGLADTRRATVAFHDALDETKRLYGNWNVSWGEVHRVRKGALDLPMAGGSGLMGCFRVAGFRRAADDKLVVSGGDSWVFAVEFAETPRAYTIVGYSQSEIEGTPHFADQAPLYSANTLKRAAFTDAEIERELIKRYRP